jgi:hypothetical protein
MFHVNGTTIANFYIMYKVHMICFAKFAKKDHIGCNHYNKNKTNYNQCLIFHILMSKIVLMLQVIQNHS